MKLPLSLAALKAQFEQQNSELTRIQRFLGSLDARFGFDVDSQLLEAIDTAVEIAPQGVRSSALVPRQGMRA